MGQKVYRVTDETKETLLKELPSLPAGMFWRIKPGQFSELLNSDDVQVQLVQKMTIFRKKSFRFLGFEIEYGGHVVPFVDFNVIDSRTINEVANLREVIRAAADLKTEYLAKERRTSIAKAIVGDYEVDHD